MANPGNKKTKSFTIQFGYGRLAAFCLLGCLVLVWMFILGILVGRGAIPDPFQLPFLARFNWTTLQQDPPKVILPESLATAKEEEAAKQEKKKPAPAPPEEEVRLHFPDVLDKKKVEVPGVLSRVVEDQKKDDSSYTVQLASFKDGAQAQEYLQKMAEKNITCYMSPAKAGDVQWFRIRTGRFDDLDSARSMVKELQEKYGLKPLAVKLH